MPSGERSCASSDVKGGVTLRGWDASQVTRAVRAFCTVGGRAFFVSARLAWRVIFDIDAFHVGGHDFGAVDT